MNRQSLGCFQGSGNTLCDAVMMDMYHYTFVKIHKIYESEP